MRRKEDPPAFKSKLLCMLQPRQDNRFHARPSVLIRGRKSHFNLLRFLSCLAKWWSLNWSRSRSRWNGRFVTYLFVPQTVGEMNTTVALLTINSELDVDHLLVYLQNENGVWNFDMKSILKILQIIVCVRYRLVRWLDKRVEKKYQNLVFSNQGGNNTMTKCGNSLINGFIKRNILERGRRHLLHILHIGSGENIT